MYSTKLEVSHGKTKKKKTLLSKKEKDRLWNLFDQQITPETNEETDSTQNLHIVYDAEKDEYTV